MGQGQAGGERRRKEEREERERADEKRDGHVSID